MYCVSCSKMNEVSDAIGDRRCRNQLKTSFFSAFRVAGEQTLQKHAYFTIEDFVQLWTGQTILYIWWGRGGPVHLNHLAYLSKHKNEDHIFHSSPNQTKDSAMDDPLDEVFYLLSSFFSL